MTFSPAVWQVQLVTTDVDVQFLLDSEDINLRGMDGVEDEGEEKRQEEGRPPTQQKVEDGVEGKRLHQRLTTSSHDSQYGQAGVRVRVIMMYNVL